MELAPNSQPRVSVIVPTRDRTDLLRRCLLSLARQDADPACYEILVCDDGSAEAPAELIGEFQPGPPLLRLLSQKPLGPAAARNLGIRSTNAPLVIFLDSDVIPDKGLVQALLKAMDAHPEWMGAEACLVPSGTEADPLWEAPAAPNGGRYHTAAIAYRREALVAVGGFDEQFLLPACEDVELAVRVLQLGLIGFVPDAKAFHPRRRVTWASRWRQRRNWKYVTILAKRYAILAFPDRKVGRFPRMRVALAAVLTLPSGRLREGIRYVRQCPAEGLIASVGAMFDVFCGVCTLPEILLSQIPARKSCVADGPTGRPLDSAPERTS